MTGKRDMTHLLMTQMINWNSDDGDDGGDDGGDDDNI